VALLEIAGLTKRFGSLVALDDVTLDVSHGEVHCLLGENGAGKSTLCNVIFGVHPPDAGTLTLAGKPFLPHGPADALRQGIAMVHQHFSLVPTMTVIENVMLGRASAILKPDAALARLRYLADEYDLEVNPHRVVESLSVGERQRVEIIKCLLGEPRLLVLDEPTAVLRPEEVDTLLAICRQVARRSKAVILVTHKLAEIGKVADRTTVLRQGRVVDTVRMEGADMRSLVRSMVGRDVRATDTVVAATIGIDDGAPAQASGTAPASRRAPMPVETNASEAALEVDELSFRDRDGVVRLAGVTFSVRRGEIIGIAGVEGNGQSELSAILSGLATPSSGSIKVGGRDLTGSAPREITAAGVGVIPEDRHAVGCIQELSVAENLFLGSTAKFSRFGLLNRSAMKEAASATMREFDVRADSADMSISALSGGNQQKAILARELSRDPLLLLVAAQPTRGLDVGAVEAVYGRIRMAKDRGLGVLLISSELDELIAVCDRLLVLYRGKIIGDMSAGILNREAIGAMMSGHAHV
jgi:general nucleoside transport system ATP-binding protein